MFAVMKLIAKKCGPRNNLGPLYFAVLLPFCHWIRTILQLRSVSNFSLNQTCRYDPIRFGIFHTSHFFHLPNRTRGFFGVSVRRKTVPFSVLNRLMKLTKKPENQNFLTIVISNFMKMSRM